MKETTMHHMLAGHLPLSDLIRQQLDGARVKLAEAEEKKDEKKDLNKKVDQLLKMEKKEHKDEAKEKESSAFGIDLHDPTEVEKLASALEYVGEKLASDTVVNGGESKQGGTQLPVQAPTNGTQAVSKAHSTKHSVPMQTGMKSTKDNPGAATAVPTDDERAPGGNGAKYPEKGVLKTASSQVHQRIAALREKTAGAAPRKEQTKQASAGEVSAAVEYILAKVAESQQGGEQIPDDSKKAPGYGSVQVPSNPGRQLISSNAAPAAATKVQAKAPVKKQLSEVLTEPAQTKSTDSVVHDNLRNASKGGVKIAAARAALQKIAEEGCKCDGKGECQYCKLKAAQKK